MIRLVYINKSYGKNIVFENAKLIGTGSLLGVRETRRIIGDYVLNFEDYKKRAVFDDEIGRYSYPIDIHPRAAILPNTKNTAGISTDSTNTKKAKATAFPTEY